MSNVLEVKGLYKSFRKNFWSSQSLVLRDLSFSVPRAVAVGFLGANGSGKTTTFKCILELLKKDSGEVRFFGELFSLKTRSRIGFLPERPQFYEDLTALESLYFYSSLSRPLSNSLKSQIDQGLKKMNLHKWRDKRLKTFSKGMQQKLGILQALIHEPELLILDEPFSGLDPESRFAVMDLLKQRIQKGCSLFLSSHIFQDIERLCDKLIILKAGQVVFEGDYSKLQPQTGRQSIVYLLNGKKRDLLLSSSEEAQKELKRLLLEGAVILSVQSEGGGLEQKYRELVEASQAEEKP